MLSGLCHFKNESNPLDSKFDSLGQQQLLPSSAP
jgi:hypothetical protein